MTEAVRGHVLRPERRHRSRRGRHVSDKLEPDARCPERLAIPVDEHRFIRCPWLPLQQCLEEHYGFRPERADAFLAPLAKKPHATRRFEPDGLRAQIERLLDPRSAVVEEG